MPSLTVQVPGGEPDYYEFDEPHITIGRSMENSIIIPDDSLSSSHAQLVRNEDGAYTLMDLGSTNGTYVEGEPISQQVLGESVSLAFGQVTAFWQASGGKAQPLGGGVPAGAGASAGAAAGGALAIEEFKPMGRPANFKSISPIPKRAKKEPAAVVAMLLGVLALLCAGALVGAVMVML